MTFDDWAKEKWFLIDVKENAKAIWDAATLIEREACAEDSVRLNQQIATLQAKLDRAKEYMQHLDSCRKIREHYWAAECTCGMSAFLAEIEKEKNDD